MDRRNEGWVYFIQAKIGGPVKIGYAGSKDGINERLKAIQVGNPLKLHIVGSIPGGRDLEKDLHARLRKHRMSGEWFRPEPEVVEVTGCASNGRTCPEWEKDILPGLYTKGYKQGYADGKFGNESDAERDTAKRTAQQQGKLLAKMFKAIEDGPEKDEIHRAAMKFYGEIIAERHSPHLPKWLVEYVPTALGVGGGK